MVLSSLRSGTGYEATQRTTGSDNNMGRFGTQWEANMVIGPNARVDMGKHQRRLHSRLPLVGGKGGGVWIGDWRGVMGVG